MCETNIQSRPYPRTIFFCFYATINNKNNSELKQLRNEKEQLLQKINKMQSKVQTEFGDDEQKEFFDLIFEKTSKLRQLQETEALFYERGGEQRRQLRILQKRYNALKIEREELITLTENDITNPDNMIQEINKKIYTMDTTIEKLENEIYEHKTLLEETIAVTQSEPTSDTQLLAMQEHIQKIESDIESLEKSRDEILKLSINAHIKDALKCTFYPKILFA